MLDDKEIAAARAEDMETLAILDERGLLIAPGESPDHYADRLKTLRKKTAEFRKKLDDEDKIDVEGLIFHKKDLIPKHHFKEARKQCRELYGVSPDWVPGFFTSKSLGLLFGGCAFISAPEFFSLFIIRGAFRDKEKWLHYHRNELMAHELCHIARSGYECPKYEEFLAYQTAKSGFRRKAGGIFYSQWDTYLFLLSAFLPCVIQFYNLGTGSRIPMLPFWGVTALVILFFMLRCLTLNGRAGRARALLDKCLHKKCDSTKLLFRCSDSEVATIANAGSAEKLSEWLRDRAEQSLRWRVILNRFPIK